MLETVPDESVGEELTEEQQDTEEVTDSTEDPVINIMQDFPMTIEDGKLTMESIFEYSGINFDCDEAICEEIGALHLKNTSDEYLQSADIKVLLPDGLELCFLIEDVPAGESVLAFDTKNQTYDENQLVEKVTTEVVWKEKDSETEDCLEVSVNGTQISVQNVSEEKLRDITLKYHCSLDGIYLGGKSYEKTLDSLEAQECVTIDAVECYLGETVVVDILD